MKTTKSTLAVASMALRAARDSLPDHAKAKTEEVHAAAINSTGLESRHVSACFTKRCKKHQGHHEHHYPKLSAICDTRNHLVLGIVIDRGPKPDPVEAQPTLHEARVGITF